MLRSLSIRDFVIVSALELEFSSGFTALTGETGAGKSILIDALSLALGERGDATMVRKGCERAEICAEFDIAALPYLQAWLREQELQGDEQVCLLRRVLDNTGRSRGFINGRGATIQQMRETGARLVAIHGQHAHQSLLHPEGQRILLDGYGGTTRFAEQVAELHGVWQDLRRTRMALTENAAGVSAERELLQYQRKEIESLQFSGPEWQACQEEHRRLSHAASLLETASVGLEVLSEAEDSCLAKINAALARIRDGVQHDGALKDALTMLESAQAEVQEAVYSLRHYQQHLDSDPDRLREHEERIQSVMDMARKYRASPEELEGVLRRILSRLEELACYDDLSTLEQRELAAQERYLAAAKVLSEARAKSAEKLSLAVTEAFQVLAMKGGRFVVLLRPLDQGGAQGLDAIDFHVALNPGVDLQSLAKVASGGELSRISLAIQVATSGLAGVPTLIFDEVDSGIGGRVAEIVGKMLKTLGEGNQVLCVTHLPQVAAAADHQWAVSKTTENGTTFSSIMALRGEQRVEEIARMLGGVRITDTTRRHAAEMLGVIS